MTARTWTAIAAVLGILLGLAIWNVVDFEDDFDPEFPEVVRPTFSPVPPMAYRLSEPGDTLDRVALYLVAGATVLCAIGWHRSWRLRRTSGLWPAALAMCVAGLWHAATPGPCPDGWHGLGWRNLGNAEAPWSLRAGLTAALVALSAIVLWSIRSTWAERVGWLSAIRGAGLAPILGAATVLIAGRQFEISGVEPPGYWPRWSLIAGLFLLDVAIGKLIPPRPPGESRWTVAIPLTAWAGLIALGLTLLWYQRPLERLKAVVPGRIYISAMPTYRGLELAHARHRFRTIINLFPERTLTPSPHWEDEVRFAAEHGINYLVPPVDADEMAEYVPQTLELARDPTAWPILVHCHACMDRTPAWAGLYRFVVQGWPIAAVMREIEQHRGYRPKGSVPHLFNYHLPRLAPAAYRADPDAEKLRESTRGTVNPFEVEDRARISRRGQAVAVSR